MRTVIVLSLVAVACAQYNYQQGGFNGGNVGGFNGVGDGVGNGLGGAFNGGSSGGHNGGFNGGSSGGHNGGFNGGSGSGNGLDGGFNGGSGLGGVDGGFNGGSGLGGVDGGSGLGDGSSPNIDSSSHSAPQGSFAAPQAGIERQFYTYTVDENDFNDDDARRVAESVKKPSRVVFIKGPQNKGLEDAALALARNAGQQTAIYVLNRQTDISDLANKLNSVNNNNNNRPEVHFVKYRTAEDAVNAQRAIQGQYDALGGNSKNYDGGVAPLLNFASQAPAASAPVAAAPGNSYLPSSVLRLVRH